MKQASKHLPPVLLTAFLGVFALGVWVPTSASASADNATFSEKVLPILTKHCSECHAKGGVGEQASGLDLTSYEGVMKGTTHGAIIVPGDAFLSNMMVLIEGRAGPELKMPHGRKDLTRWEKTLLRRWINRGAQNN
ncbi:MAG: hypothetical protein OEY84_01855 [Rhodospirillaceae bacterium]|nr:hypothetical protein [Rhodospirillaceae bacterium]